MYSIIFFWQENVQAMFAHLNSEQALLNIHDFPVEWVVKIVW